MRRPKNLYNLARPKLRASWNKYNLFNIARAVGKEPPIRGTPTFFQQKWRAKAKTRAYHGEHIPEKKWVRIFDRRLQAAVEMPPEYLAANDGSEQATGRGQGLAGSSVNALDYSKVRGVSSKQRRSSLVNLGSRWGDVNGLLAETHPHMTPHMQMVFAPLERRLDTAVFRSLFATSIRQSRQFIVHGAVRVNGKKMVHPSYQLNPGDMFQVDVEKVLYATGAPKKSKEDKRLQENLESQKKHAERQEERALARAAKRRADGAATEGKESKAADSEGADSEAAAEAGLESLTEEEVWRMNNRTLKYLLKEVKRMLSVEPKDLSATQKKQLRLFRTNAKRFLSHPDNAEIDARELIQQLALQMKNHDAMRETFQRFKIVDESGATVDASEAATEPTGEAASENAAEAVAEKPARNRSRQVFKALALTDLTKEQKEKAIRIMGDTQLSKEEIRKLGWLLKSDEENPVDDSKPYATPWRPRPFMSAFAFIPRYLEVNPNVCAAIYLRHPVARKGLAEVPTPFSYLTNQLTHNWYLERGPAS